MTRRVTPTYTLINQITLAASSSTVTFSNIPQNFGDLILIKSHKVDSPATQADWYLRFNQDSGANYFYVRMFGTGSQALSGQSSSRTFLEGFMDDTTNFSLATLQIMDYSASDKHKTILMRESLGTYQTTTSVTRWASSSPISRMDFTSADFGGDLFSVGSTFYLYGVVA